MKSKGIFGILIFTLVLSSVSGCLGFFEGYGEKAQEMTSADYVIAQYKFFIDKYNAIRQQGSMIANADVELEEFKLMHPDSQFWTRSENDIYADLRSNKRSYVMIYNRFVADYNSRMRDLTTNQPWMKPQGFPEELSSYIEGQPMVTEKNNQTLVMPSEIPQSPPGWVPPSR
ncbi:MAG: hypothetical protein KAQ87_01730 [Candidatus Pacebacteria bacterium]|nr:hypothetical protein [Candidatus Paceibacterota bacterium]